jgi:hypothetical protein
MSTFGQTRYPESPFKLRRKKKKKKKKKKKRKREKKRKGKKSNFVTF